MSDYTRDYKNGADWPICSVKFEFLDPLKKKFAEVLGAEKLPKQAICTRYYDGSLSTSFEPAVADKPIAPTSIITALTN